MPRKNWALLLTSENEWGFEIREQFHPAKTPHDCMPLLPILEESYGDVVAVIQTGLTSIGADAHLIKMFPFDHVIQRALTWETSYWPMLAVQWLENGYPVAGEFLVALERIPQVKQYTQPLRHRVQRFLKQYRTSKSL